MPTNNSLPLLGEAFRGLITGAGLRPALSTPSLSKDLDDLANEDRPGANSKLLEKLEREIWKAVENEAGKAWVEIFEAGWGAEKKSIQTIARDVFLAPIPPEEGRAAFHALISAPMTIELLDNAGRQIPGPNLASLVETPFKAWMQWFGTNAAAVETATKVDQRTIEHWLSGDPIARLCFPFQDDLKALAALNTSTQARDLKHAAGWLMIAIALQSAEPAFRTSLATYQTRKHLAPISLAKSIRDLKVLSEEHSQTYSSPVIASLERDIDAVFGQKPVDRQRAHMLVDELSTAVAALEPTESQYQRHLIDWYTARLLGLQADDENASQLFDLAVRGLWWNGGENQAHLVSEAMVYAAGIGDKVRVKHYWDSAHLLGLVDGPFREINSQDLRRYSLAFEKAFYPRKSDERVVLGEYFLAEPFKITSEMVEDPNRRVKFSGQPIRETPLMTAILQGTLEEVRALLNAGGDVNRFIKETGEGPLSYALKRAWNRKKDTDILYAILNIPSGQGREENAPNKETVNRSVGMTHETPMKFAIDIADAQVAQRLAELKADLKAPCADHAPPPLAHAVSKFAHSYNPAKYNALSQQAYLDGQGVPDARDARRGAVLPAQLAASRRQAFEQTFLNGKPDRNLQILDAVAKYHTPEASKLLEVIEVLLKNRADPNFRYIQNGHKWSPTLLAAEIGSLPLFELLISHKGDPELTLNDAGSFDRKDAFYIAFANNNRNIVAFLKERGLKKG